ncbi:hypothetical protein BpHYR1_025980 [Brachionus plicatilis]|uniref:Uncharacterized protein n=1 Tax=Brachionus plicatilis TaxID=10195 RepID=A0A3M7P8F5_BRAPC|nr:hypothetical protein BpHYR1_025980 [Brachionus plicatilis]
MIISITDEKSVHFSISYLCWIREFFDIFSENLFLIFDKKKIKNSQLNAYFTHEHQEQKY